MSKICNKIAHFGDLLVIWGLFSVYDPIISYPDNYFEHPIMYVTMIHLIRFVGVMTVISKLGEK